MQITTHEFGKWKGTMEYTLSVGVLTKIEAQVCMCECACLLQHELVPANICKLILLQHPTLGIQPLKSLVDRSCDPHKTVKGLKPHLM